MVAKSAWGNLWTQQIIFSGIGLQVILFGVFVRCAVMFHVRNSKRRFAKMTTVTPNLHAMLLSLYFSNVLIIIIRNIYRLVEYGSGRTGYLQRQGWLTYHLDIRLMASVMIRAFPWYFPDVKGEHVEGHPLIALSGAVLIPWVVL